MAQALYRRYRSQTFAEVLGQEHVTQTLQAAIREDRIGHAYLFSGSRGTGKTSTARILAKALNCEKGPTPEPCNECETCRAITEGHSLDVIEIDAASHGGVDDVRELRDNAVLAPASARRKIYIIDEAHMVSTQGWNAFLKTVEEPPEHVIFVFATTEPHKVLPTILSRCQRFDFRRISSQTLTEHLARICKEEGIVAEDAALRLIARAAEGGARDSLSTLDQLAAGGDVTLDAAARLLGSAGNDVLFEFTEALADGDTARAVRMIARLVDDGQDLRVYARAMVDHLRALLLSKQIDDPGDLIDATEETRARYAAQADRFSAGKLVHTLKLFVDAMGEMRQQATPRLTVELAVVRATMPEVDDSAQAAIARIERLERVFEVGGTPQPSTPAAAQPRAEQPPAEPPRASAEAVRPPPPQKPQQAKKAEPPPPAPELSSVEPVGLLDIDKVRRSWAIVLEKIRPQSRKLHALLGEATPLGLDGDLLKLELRFDFHAKEIASPKNAAMLGDAMRAVFGVAPRVTTTVAAQAREEESMDDVGEPAPDIDPLDVVRAGFGDGVVEE